MPRCIVVTAVQCQYSARSALEKGAGNSEEGTATCLRDPRRGDGHISQWSSGGGSVCATSSLLPARLRDPRRRAAAARGARRARARRSTARRSCPRRRCACSSRDGTTREGGFSSFVASEGSSDEADGFFFFSVHIGREAIGGLIIPFADGRVFRESEREGGRGLSGGSRREVTRVVVFITTMTDLDGGTARPSILPLLGEAAVAAAEATSTAAVASAAAADGDGRGASSSSSSSSSRKTRTTSASVCIDAALSVRSGPTIVPGMLYTTVTHVHRRGALGARGGERIIRR